MRTLSGRTVALLESRQADELAAMVERLGGIAVRAPAVQERPVAGDFAPLLARIIAGEFPLAIALTGAALNALFAYAGSRGQHEALRGAMAAMTLACRGPKPQAALRRQGLVATIVTDRPHTTTELLIALESARLTGVPAILLHYGECNLPFSTMLKERGALVQDVCLYEWALPDDVQPLHDVVRRLIAGDVDALLVTSQIQFRFLMQIAEAGGLAGALLSALNHHVVVGAVGPVCASAIKSAGGLADILPASPNSASLVGALADYFELMGS
jgi:uroporphyrinogen-III synthase